MPKISWEIVKLQEEVENKFGKHPYTPADFNDLIMDIQKNTQKRISLSTVERLWGYVNNVEAPSVRSLDTLAMYVGYKDWHECNQYLNEKAEGRGNHILKGEIRTKDLGIGRLIEVHIGPTKYQFRYIGGNKFEVVDAKHSMLQPGDTFETLFFMKDRPLYMANVKHNGKEPFFYAAGGARGITYVRIVNPELNLPLTFEEEFD